MQKHVLLNVLVSLVLCNVICGQDTAYQRIMSLTDDSIKIDNLISYASKYSFTQPDKFKRHFKEVIRLSKKLNYNRGLGYGWQSLGNLFSFQGNDEEAKRCYRTSILYYDRYKTYTNESIVTEVALSRMNLGSTFSTTGRTDSAMYYLLEAISYLERRPYPTPELALSYYGVGSLERIIKDQAKAVFYFEKAQAVARQLTEKQAAKYSDMLILLFSNVASLYRELKVYDKAHRAMEEAIHLAQKFGRPGVEKLSADLTGLKKEMVKGEVSKEVLASAVKDNVENRRNAEKANNIAEYLTTTLALADNYDKLNRQEERIHVLQEAIKKCEQHGSIHVKINFYKALSEAYKKIGNYKEAYNYYIDQARYEDAVFNEMNNKVVSELEIQYQTSQKAKALSQKQLQIAQKDLELQNSQQHTFYSLGAALIAMLVAGFFYIDFRHKKKLHQRRLKSIEQEKEIQLLQALMQGEEKERSRIAKDLHDGVAGMLAAVKMHFSSLPVQMENIVQAEGYKQGIKLLDEASREVRKTSHNLMPEVLLQHGLDEALARYCSSISNASTLLIEYDSIGIIDRYVDNFELSVYRIVQELLNNILKHSKASQAVVQLSQQKDILAITIEDNGVGFSSHDIDADGMGLRSLKSRVEAINGKIELESGAGSGVSAYLEFEVGELINKTNMAVEPITAYR